MIGYIYKRVHKVSGKIYIGQHHYTKPELDPKYRGSGVIFMKALKKYGDDAFTLDLIAIADTQEELDALEEKLANTYKKLNDEVVSQMEFHRKMSEH